MGNTITTSQDGSHTLVSDKFGVSYHSKYGAIQETQTVFIDAGLNHQIENGLTSMRILEMGFGTGLNALMTLMQIPDDIVIHYHTLEAYPISKDTARTLNYPEVLDLSPQQKEAFIAMHECDSDHKIQINSNFTFTKHLIKIEDYDPTEMFDIVYYDAFAPTSQEELWTPELMQRISKWCNLDAVLVTYCAKGSFKRALRSAGFSVEGIPGPIGKREMTRATLNAN